MKMYKTNQFKDIVISNPDIPLDDVIIAFGGVGFNEIDMFNAMPRRIKNRYKIITAPYYISYPKVLDMAEIYLNNGNTLSPLNQIVLGFSAGGRNVQSHYDPNFKLAGLIDTSIRPIDNNVNYQDNTILLFNYSNWDNTMFYFDFKDHINDMVNKIRDNGGKIYFENIGHYDMPKYFLDNFL